jgi:hypothetical protein
MNQRLMMMVLRILKNRINHTQNLQSKSAFIFAYNLIVYAMQGNENKINEIYKKEVPEND